MQNTGTQIATQNKIKGFYSYPLVEVNRTFNAPVELVWAAWSQSELIKQWWGPEGFTCPDAKINFKIGGTSLLAMRDPNGKTVWSTGTYREIVPFEKIVTTDSFADENGKIVTAKELGFTGDWPAVCYITITFRRVDDDSTSINIKHDGVPTDMHDDCVDGWNSSLNKMQTLVEKNYPI